MNLETNVLIAGKTGVGKSEFINYIYGDHIRESMAGRPVTGVGLHKETFKLDGLTVNLYDSWGLEADQADQWTKEILSKVDERDKSTDIKDWFHTIFYCFSAQSARIEDFERHSILSPLIRSGNKVIVIFTHCDVKGVEDKIEGMRKSLNAIGIQNKNIICVASKKKKLLNGTYKEPFGKEEVVSAIRDNLWTFIRGKIIKQYKGIIEETFTKWRAECLAEIEANVKLTNLGSAEKNLISTFINKLNEASTKISYNCSSITKTSCDYYNRLQNQVSLTLHNSNYDVYKDEVHVDLNDILKLSQGDLGSSDLKNAFAAILTCTVGGLVTNIASTVGISLVAGSLLTVSTAVPLLAPISITTGVILGNKKKKEIKESLTSKVNNLYYELSRNTDKVVLEFSKKLPRG